MSDTPRKEMSLPTGIRNDSSSLSDCLRRLYLTSDDEPATAELAVGPVTGKINIQVNVVEGKEQPLVVPVKQKTGALLIKTIGGIKQAWGVAINRKDQLIVVAGREGLEDEMPDEVKRRACKDDVNETANAQRNDKVKNEKSAEVKKDEDQCGGDCILLFSPEGKKISSFGPKGDDDGQFDMPRGVAVDDCDDIYVVDKLNYRVQKISSDGVHLGSWGKKGHGPREFDWPKAISIHPRTKNVYVTEANNHRVQILTKDLTFIRTIGAIDKDGKPTMGIGNGEFNIPLGVAFDKDERVYITDAVNDRIQVFTESGGIIASFGGKGNGAGQLGFPSSICIDENNILYVTEIDNHRISVFEITDRNKTVSASAKYTHPKFLFTFGERPDDPYYFGGIAVKNGVVYVTDSYYDELRIFLI